MNSLINHIQSQCKRNLLLSATVLLVLLSSCAVKMSIKTLVGLPVKMEQSIPKGLHNLSSSTVQACAQLFDLDSSSIQKSSFKTWNVLPAVVLMAAFLLLPGFIAVRKENVHPLYGDSGEIQNAIPLFLKYRKLIIHFWN